MNSQLLQAPGKAQVQRAEGKALLSRNTWGRMLALAIVTLLSIASAFAGTGIQVADTGMFRPRGMVRSFVFVPANGATPAHVLSDYWVADGASGFCRIDMKADPRLPVTTGSPTHGVLDLGTCYLPGVFEAADYQAETFGVNGSNGYIFVAGINEVSRIEFTVDPTDPTKTAINKNTQVSIFNGASSVFANGAPVGRNRAVQSAKLGPDGKLYICFQGNGDIWRIRNPLSPTFTPAGNVVERVGTSDNGKTLLSLTWIGHDLWMAQAGFLNRIQNADLCHYQAPQCQAVLQFGKLQIQEGLETDQFDYLNPNGRWLYWANGNRVLRFDTFSSNIMQVWTQNGFVNGSVSPHNYTLIMGMNFVQPAMPGFPANPVDATDPTLRPLVTLTDPSALGGLSSELDLTMDITLEAPVPGVGGILPKTGVTYKYPTTAATKPEPCTPNALDPRQACLITSQVGTDSPPNVSPQNVAARRGVLMLSGVTHPRGLLWLQSNFWVSDEQNGFCRIDQNPITGVGSMSNCFKANFSFIPGQAAADAPDAFGRQNVYVPDSSGSSRGIIRLAFTPGPFGGTVSETGFINAGPGTVAAVALPQGPFNDGALYVGYYDNGGITKIGTPSTAPTGPQPVARTGNSVGVLSMAFRGNDLYLAELGPPANPAGQLVKGGQVTVIQAASPGLIKGNARIVTKPISRLQSPTLVSTPQLFINPSAMAVGPVGDRESCLPPPGVKLSPIVPADPGTAPGLFMGNLGLPPASAVSGGLAQNPEVDQFGFICTTEIPWVAQGALDPLLSINTDLGPVMGIAFNSNAADATMAIADDPSLIVPDQTLQRSKISPPATGGIGQGHVFIVQ